MPRGSYLYSSNQIGRGLGEIEVYSGPIYHYHRQGGGGIGSFITHAYQYLKPFISSGINALKDQGIESTGSILSQLGDKKFKNILEDEGQKALKNLKSKAINKLKSVGKGQSGKGMRIGSKKPKKKSIKSGRVAKKTQTGGKRKRKSKKTKTQIGAGRKRKTKSKTLKRKTAKKRRKHNFSKQLDIFD